MLFKSINTDVVDQLLIIALDRPKANAIDAATSFEIYQAVAMLEQDRVLLFPVGKAFLSFRCEPFRSRLAWFFFFF